MRQSTLNLIVKSEFIMRVMKIEQVILTVKYYDTVNSAFIDKFKF